MYSRTMEKLILAIACFAFIGAHVEGRKCMLSFEAVLPGADAGLVKFEKMVLAKDSSECAMKCYEEKCKRAAYSAISQRCFFLQLNFDAPCAFIERHFEYVTKETIWIQCIRPTCINEPPHRPRFIPTIGTEARITERDNTNQFVQWSEIKNGAVHITTGQDDRDCMITFEVIEPVYTSGFVEVKRRVDAYDASQCASMCYYEEGCERAGFNEYFHSCSFLVIDLPSCTKAERYIGYSTSQTIWIQCIKPTCKNGKAPLPKVLTPGPITVAKETTVKMDDTDVGIDVEIEVVEKTKITTEPEIVENNSDLKIEVIEAIPIEVEDQNVQPTIAEKSGASKTDKGLLETRDIHTPLTLTKEQKEGVSKLKGDNDEASTIIDILKLNVDGTESTMILNQTSMTDNQTVENATDSEMTMEITTEHEFPETAVAETTIKIDEQTTEKAIESVTYRPINVQPVNVERQFLGPYVCGLRFSVEPLYLYPIGDSINFEDSKLAATAAECAGLCFLRACSRAAYDPLTKLCSITVDGDIPDSCSTASRNPVYTGKDLIWIQCPKCDIESVPQLSEREEMAGLTAEEHHRGDLTLQARLKQKKSIIHDIVQRKISKDSLNNITETPETTESCIIGFEVDENIVDNGQFTGLTFTVTAANCARRCLASRCTEAIFEPSSGRCLMAFDETTTQCDSDTELTVFHRVQWSFGIRCIKCVNESIFERVFGAETIHGPIDQWLTTSAPPTTTIPAIITTRKEGCWISFEVAKAETNLAKFTEFKITTSVFKCVRHCYRNGCSQVTWNPSLNLCFYSYDPNSGNDCGDKRHRDYQYDYSKIKIATFQCLRLQCGTNTNP